MNTEKFKVRKLTPEDMETVTSDDVVYVRVDVNLVGDVDEVYAEATLDKSGSEFAGGIYDVTTIFGDEQSLRVDVGPDGIYVPDKTSDFEIRVLQSAGLIIHTALFFPGIGEEGSERFFAAVRQEFEETTVRLFNHRENHSRLVPDAKVDVFQVPITRGRKPAEGPKEVKVAENVYPPYAELYPVAEGSKKSIRPHQKAVETIPTI